jgi:hypothetical protein
MAQLNHTRRKSLTRLCGIIVLLAGCCYLKMDKRATENAAMATERTNLIPAGSNGTPLPASSDATLADTLQKTGIAAIKKAVVNGAASFLHTSNLRLKALTYRSSVKVRETTNVIKAEALRIMFHIEEPGIAKKDDKELYIRVIAPNGNILGCKADPAGALINCEGKTVNYSAKKKIILTPTEMAKEISIDIDRSGDYEKGNYDIEIYNDGHEVGNGSITLQ